MTLCKEKQLVLTPKQGTPQRHLLIEHMTKTCGLLVCQYPVVLNQKLGRSPSLRFSILGRSNGGSFFPIFSGGDVWPCQTVMIRGARSGRSQNISRNGLPPRAGRGGTHHHKSWMVMIMVGKTVATQCDSANLLLTIYTILLE